MRTKLFSVVAGAALLVTAAAVPVIAHHSFAAEFDAKKPVKLRGTVKKMEWINPHSWIHLDVKNPDGTVTKWMIEGGTPNTLLRRGFTRDSLIAHSRAWSNTLCQGWYERGNRDGTDPAPSLYRFFIQS